MNKPKKIISLILLILFFSLSCVSLAKAQTPSSSVEFTNPLVPTTIEGVAENLLNSLRNIVALLALVFIVIGGLMYIFSAGQDKRIETAKKIITGAIIGLVIVLIAPSLLKEIGTILGWSGAPAAITLYQIATNVLTTLLSISGIIAMIFLVIGGLTYMGGFSTVTGSGDKEKNIANGKKIITSSIIGIALIMGALVIVKQISLLFG